MLRTLAPAVLAVLLGFAASSAPAHGPHALKSFHGGEVKEGRRHHLELVILPKPGDPKTALVQFYVRDQDDRPVDLSKGRGEALVTVNDRRVRVELRPAGGNQLAGEAVLDADPGMRVQVTAEAPGMAQEQAVYRPFAQARRK